MWIKGKHVEVDNQGRPVSRAITLNLERAICYVEMEENRTRVFFYVGHDLEDHRNATWVDLQEPKEKLDMVLSRHKISR